MNKITTMREFTANINERGPGSGKSFQQTLEEIMPIDVFQEWQLMMAAGALELAGNPQAVQNLLEEAEEELDEMTAASAIMTMALERVSIAAFAAGLFTGLAAVEEQGFLKSTPKNGWDNIGDLFKDENKED